MIHRREIDGLRALAVIPVILFHAGLPVFPGGFVGVDVFFVISGFLICTLIQQDLQWGKFELVKFYERRLRRIMPALVVVMLACIPAAWMLLPPSEMKDFAESLAAVSVFLSNWLFWSESGYFDSAAELKPLLHTWSLAVEEQFYLLFPLMLSLFSRFRRAGYWMLAALALASLLAGHWQTIHHPNAAFYLLPARFWELAAGALAALWMLSQPTEIRPWLRQIGSVAGLLMILGAELLYSRDTVFPGLPALLPVVGTVMVIVWASPDNLAGRFLGSPLLVGIGLISYSAYLWHQPVLAFSRYLDFNLEAHVAATLFSALSLGLAWLSWRYVERPFRLPGLISGTSIFRLAISVGLAFVVLGLAGHRYNGFPKERASGAKLQLFETAVQHPKTKGCSTAGQKYRKPEDACVFGEGAKEVAVMGDSHAAMLGYPIAEALNPLGFRVRVLSFRNCYPADMQLGNSACSAWTKDTVDYLVANKEISTVVISYRLYLHLYGNHVGTYPEQATAVDAGTRERRWQSYVNIIHRLAANGKRVIVFRQVPELKRRINDLIFMEPNPVEPLVGVTRRWWNGRRELESSRRKDLPDNILIVDPTADFCDETNCYVTGDDTAYYFDSNHLSSAGSAKVVSRLIACARQRGYLSIGDNGFRPSVCE